MILSHAISTSIMKHCRGNVFIPNALIKIMNKFCFIRWFTIMFMSVYVGSVDTPNYLPISIHTNLHICDWAHKIEHICTQINILAYF